MSVKREIHVHHDPDLFMQLSALAYHAELFAESWLKHAKHPERREEAAERIVAAVVAHRSGTLVHPVEEDLQRRLAKARKKAR